jgi:hypothetical protein
MNLATPTEQAKSLLANPNPSLLDIHMVADLTTKRMDQLRFQLSIPAATYGQLYYINHEVQQQRAENRPFGLWSAMLRFWELYESAITPRKPAPAAASKPRTKKA